MRPFLEENADLSANTQAKLSEILHNPQQLLSLKVELAAIVDMGIHFVRATSWKGMDFLYSSAMR